MKQLFTKWTRAEKGVCNFVSSLEKQSSPVLYSKSDITTAFDSVVKIHGESIYNVSNKLKFLLVNRKFGSILFSSSTCTSFNLILFSR